MDDESGDKASVEFFVLGDQRILWKSGIMKKGDPALLVDVNLKGIQKLALYVSDGGDYNYYDHSDWLEAFIEYRKEPPVVMEPPVQEPYILTPPVSEKPVINGPSVFGATPGRPFLYKIPVTGKKPVVYSVDNLPATLKLDATTGIITGITPGSGEYKVSITVKNETGES